MSTKELRETFLVEKLFEPGEVLAGEISALGIDRQGGWLRGRA